MPTLRLHNSRTRRKEDFAPIDPSNVRMYVCGPTVYDRAHLGNARPVVVFDVLFRLLRHVYGADHVTYVRNFTDVDDKINARAREMQDAGDGRDLNAIIRALTDETIGWYHADMGALGALRPAIRGVESPLAAPRATEYIVQMVAMIEALTRRISPTTGRPHAYAEQGHVLFDVRSYPDYGMFSGRSLEDMVAGARVEVAPYKRDPMDFVLWKPSDADEPGWDSPWGRGRPGWHIECSAMSHDLLGPAFDIHGGGLDLQFPHHENEIAQSCCAHPGEGFANVWMHNEMLLVEGKKMSKSLGNFFTVRDLLDQGVPGEVIRFVMLSTHYRKPMDWTEEKAREAKEKLLTWSAQIHEDQEFLANLPSEPTPDPILVAALSDDLNTSLALSRLDALAKEARTSDTAKAAFIASLDLLGFDHKNIWKVYFARSRQAFANVAIHFATKRLTQAREQAIASKDFSEVDRLKALFIAAGVEVRMSKSGVELIPGLNFDPNKLDALK